MPNITEFKPTMTSQLTGQISMLRTKTSEIAIVEKDFGINDGVDGIKGSKSELENALYASLVFGENKQSVLDGIYYLKRCLLINSNPYEFYKSYDDLVATAQKSFGATDAEIGGVIVKAYVDHLLKNNANAKQLIRDLGTQKGTEYIEAIAQCWYMPGPQTRQKVLDLAKALVPQTGVFPVATFKSFHDLVADPLKDSNLFSALLKVQQNWNNGLPVDSVTLVSSR